MGPVLDLQGVRFGFALLGLVLGAHLWTALFWHFPGTGSIFGERHWDGQLGRCWFALQVLIIYCMFSVCICQGLNLLECDSLTLYFILTCDYKS